MRKVYALRIVRDIKNPVRDRRTSSGMSSWEIIPAGSFVVFKEYRDYIGADVLRPGYIQPTAADYRALEILKENGEPAKAECAFEVLALSEFPAYNCDNLIAHLVESGFLSLDSLAEHIEALREKAGD